MLTENSAKVDRRDFINASIAGGLILAVFGAGGLLWIDRQRFLNSKLFQLISADSKWDSNYLKRFLEDLDLAERFGLVKPLGLEHDIAPEEIIREMAWTSSNVLTYPPRDKTDFAYHAMVKWSAQELGISQNYLETDSTFSLEARMLPVFFENIWDSLSYEQRFKLLEDIEDQGTIANKTKVAAGNAALSDKAAIASLSGAAALATLSTTGYFTGFSFYMTMSIVISTVAGFFNLTLPFAAYTGAENIVAFLSGPIGWALTAISALAGVAMLGRADVQRTTAFILQVHSLKIKRILSEKQERRFSLYLPSAVSFI